MKQLVIFINILLGLIWWGCDSQPIPSPSNSSIGNIQTRGIITASSLPTGSKALFNASGGIALTNAVFSFDGTQWESSGEPLTLDSSKETSLTAIYPAKNDETTLITQNPYVENALEDVLIAQHTSTGQTNIELEFKHLFAMLTINVASSVNASLTEIAIEAPKVTSINGANGTFSTSGTHTTTLSRNNDGIYSFIVPPVNDCPLSIIFNSGEEQLSHTLTHNFESGYKYECNAVGTDTRPGIKTAEELIAFSKFINGDLPKEEWSRFGYIEGEDTIYSLLNDITMLDKDNALFSPIGNNFQHPFSAIFDGGNHKITGLNTSAFYGVAGLFGRITPTGIIKKLHLENSTASITNSTASGIGILAGICYGTIDNCSVTNCSININGTYPTGGLVGHLRAGGYIINSYAKNSNIKSTGYVGGLAGQTKDAHIINCYITSSSILNNGSTYSGGIAGYADKSNIINCYKYNIALNDSGERGQIIGYARNTTIDYIFYDKQSPGFIKDTDNTNTTGYYKRYDTSSFKTIVGELYVYSLLNQWINEQTTYPHTFNIWEESQTLPATFKQ